MIIFLTVSSIVKCDCTLDLLYKDQTRQSLVRARLSNLFDFKFAEAIEEVRLHARYLIPPANHYRKDLKKFFIEYGQQFNDYHDLETQLKSLNYTQIPLFKAYKEDVEKFGTDLIID